MVHRYSASKKIEDMLLDAGANSDLQNNEGIRPALVTSGASQVDSPLPPVVAILFFLLTKTEFRGGEF